MALKLDSFQVWSELFRLLGDNSRLVAYNWRLTQTVAHLEKENAEYKQQILQFCADHPQDSANHPFPEAVKSNEAKI